MSLVRASNFSVATLPWSTACLPDSRPTLESRACVRPLSDRVPSLNKLYAFLMTELRKILIVDSDALALRSLVSASKPCRLWLLCSYRSSAAC